MKPSRQHLLLFGLILFAFLIAIVIQRRSVNKLVAEVEQILGGSEIRVRKPHCVIPADIDDRRASARTNNTIKNPDPDKYIDHRVNDTTTRATYSIGVNNRIPVIMEPERTF